MNSTKVKIIKGFLVLIITLAILLTGQIALQRYSINKPLTEALQRINGVQSVSIIKKNITSEPLRIEISLGTLNNIQKTYDGISNVVENALDKKAFNIIIKDNRNIDLETSFDRINLYIQKAKIDGDFPLLAEKTQEISKESGISSMIFVSEKFIYLQMNKNEYSLYMVEPRYK